MVYPRVFADVLGLASPFFSRTQEFAFYRVLTGKIVEVWVTAVDLVLLTQLQE